MRMVLGLRSLTSRSRSAPRITGIFWSLTTTCTGSRPTIASAACGSVVACTWYWPRNSMDSERRMRSSSSISSSVGFLYMAMRSLGGLRGVLLDRRRLALRRRAFHRQADHELGALARHRGHLDAAAVGLHDLVADRQPQAGALADGLGGE